MRLQVPDCGNEVAGASLRAPGLNHREPRPEDPRNRDDGKRASATWCGCASCRFTSGGASVEFVDIRAIDLRMDRLPARSCCVFVGRQREIV